MQAADRGCVLEDFVHFPVILLISVMQAANPGCVLEDFVRWYSPRDWVEEKIETADGTVVSRGILFQHLSGSHFT